MEKFRKIAGWLVILSGVLVCALGAYGSAAYAAIPEEAAAARTLMQLGGVLIVAGFFFVWFFRRAR